MAYPKIDQIKIGGNQSGEAFGGFIYSTDMKVGYQAEPSQLVINIINESGSYDISESDLRMNGNPTAIDIGNLEFKMYPLKYKISKSKSKRSLTVTYVDQSALLDRVYIGLLNEHTRQGVENMLLQFQIPVVCSSCDGSVTNREISSTVYRNVEGLGTTGKVLEIEQKRAWVGAVQTTFSYAETGQTVATLSVVETGTSEEMVDQTGSNLTAPTAPTVSGFTLIDQESRIVKYYTYAIPTVGSQTVNPYIFGNVQEGGVIGIGTEEFHQSSCGTGAISYSFKELKTAIKKFGIQIELVNGVETLPDGPTDFRRAYTGTLREVLQNWGRDFGFTFSYDFGSHKLIGINLRQPIYSLDLVKNTIENADSLSNVDGSPIVESVEESASLEGTYRKYHATSYQKDAHVRNFDKTVYNRAIFTPLSLADVIKTLPANYSTYDQLYIACILAATTTYDIWLSYHVDNGIWVNTGTDKKPTAGALDTQTEKGLKWFGYSQSLFEGRESTQLSDVQVLEKIFDIHKGIGEGFINQQLVNLDFTPSERHFCDRKYLDYQVSSKFDRESETFFNQNGNYGNNFPGFASLFAGFELRTVTEIANRFTSYYSYSAGAINFVSRQGQYQLSANILDGLSTSELKGFVMFNDGGDAEDKVNEGLKRIVPLATYTLTKGGTNINESQSVATANDSSDCHLVCEPDLIREICDFDRCLSGGQRSDRAWPEGLTTAPYADKLSVTIGASSNTGRGNTLGNTFTIITPSYTPFQTNFVFNYRNRYVYPGVKKVLSGELDKTNPVASDFPGNVAMVDFSSIDVTSDLDPYYDSSDRLVTDVILPEGGKKTVESYDAGIRQNQEVIYSVTDPFKQYNFSIAGILDYTQFSSILSPLTGLAGFDIRMDSQGVTTTYNYNTRPPNPPDKELVFNRIQPKFSR